MDLEKDLQKEILKAVLALQKNCKCNFNIPEIELEHPQDTKFGDFSTNIAMKIAKVQKKNPLDIAKNIVVEFEAGGALKEVQKVEVVAPGFINFYLDELFFIKSAREVLDKKEKYGASNLGKGKSVLIDYSAPNIAKPFGIHHLLGTFIGDSVKHILKFEGYKVTAENFLGDWGTQFGQVIYAYKNWGKKEKVEKDPINELLALYVRFNKEAEKDESLLDKAREEFRKLEDGDKENRELWEWMREETIQELKFHYKNLNIKFDSYRGEAHYESKLDETLKFLTETGFLTEGEKDAKIIDLEEEGLNKALFQKGDGATLYITRDFAALKDRAEKKYDKILYVVDVAQSYHFKQLFKVAEKADILKNSEPVHIAYGRMSMPEGGMSTRKGKVVFAWKVLETAVGKAGEILKEKDSEIKNQEELARIIGIGSVKYAILSQNRMRDVKFTWEKMLSLDGNSAPYIMYSFVRCKSILEKSGVLQGLTLQSLQGQTLQKEEADILRKLYLFPEIVKKSANEYEPNNISNYIFELCQLFNTFYNKLPVLDASGANKYLRLLIVEATAQVIKNGMSLLNIELPEKM